MDEVELLARCRHGHALVVGSEGAGQVQPKDTLLYGDERQGPPWRQDYEDDGQVHGGMGDEQDGFGGRVAHRLGAQGPCARDVQAQRLQASQGEEQGGLVPGHHPAQACLGAGLLHRPGDHAGTDVGVGADLVGAAVMTVVLVHPVPVADARGQVGAGQAGQVVPPARSEDLAVADVMAQEANLGEHDGEVGGYEQLVPRVAENGDGGPTGGVEPAHQRHSQPGPPRGVLEQAGGADLAGQVQVAVAVGPRRRGAATDIGAVTGTPSKQRREQGTWDHAP